MPQNPFERVQVFLSETRVNPFALLLDLTTLVPESMLERAIFLTENATEGLLRDVLLEALMMRMNRIDLTADPSFIDVLQQLSVPEGTEAKELMQQLSAKERYEVFDHWFMPLEITEERGLDRIETRIGNQGVVASIDPPDNQGGGDVVEVVEHPFVGPLDETEFGDEEGFEAIPSAAEPPAPEPAPSTVSDMPSPRRDIVNFRFAHKQTADIPLKPDEPLLCGSSYYFRLNIGEEDKEAIGAPTHIDLDKLPEEAALTVAIFGFDKELVISPGEDVGELKIQSDGSVKVQRQPVDPNTIKLSASSPADYLENYLLFPIRVPETAGTYRLRCNIYCAQVLVQSYVVTAYVYSQPHQLPEACTKKLDYVLSQSLRAGHLNSLTKEPHLLSLMLNDNGDGSHSFRFFGADGMETFKDDAIVDGQLLSNFLKQARRAMRKVSWGDEEEWDPNGTFSYRYQSQTFDRDKLAKDLAYLARPGWRIYDGFLRLLKTDNVQLQTILANSGLIQIALKLSPRAVLPAAVVYDYAWKPDQFDFPKTKFELCPTFSKALDKARADGSSLEDAECFSGKCELKAMIAEIQEPGSRKTMLDLGPMICPSGFWGYRHMLGMPLTLDGTNNDVPPVIDVEGALQMIACVSTDPGFVERDPHLGRLKALRNELKFARDEGYGAVVTSLKTTQPHLLYFYCHGGVKADSDLPYLEIGKSDQMLPNDLTGEGIVWKGPNPLVFINGCHTTSLNPEVTLDFVSAFVQQSRAAGVIGTEITIFEPLAAKFAEECLSRFIGAPPHAQSMPIGKAVRGARLELLKQGNPLGLVYIPYAVGTLRLKETQPN